MLNFVFEIGDKSAGLLTLSVFFLAKTYLSNYVFQACQGGKKKLKPSCSWCKNYDNYVENVQLRILLQCYKKLCEYITSTDIYRKLANAVINNGGSLVDLINEGAGFKVCFHSLTLK
jgi:male-specific lethal 2